MARTSFLRRMLPGRGRKEKLKMGRGIKVGLWKGHKEAEKGERLIGAFRKREGENEMSSTRTCRSPAC